MILDLEQIEEILLSPRNKHINDWKEDSSTLSIYVNGGDVASELKKIRGYENEQQEQLRKDLAKSPKDKIADILKPISKVFNATGGSIDYGDLKGATLDKVKELYDNLPEGMSLRQWMEVYLSDVSTYDPNGVVLIEVGADGTKHEGVPYPTYKSISKIHDYIEKWNKFEYLVLLHKKVEINKSKKQIFRVIDDEKDALYYLENKKLKEYGNMDGVDGFDENHLLLHNYGFIPAVVCGSIVDKHTKGKLSILNKIDENLIEYLRATSIFLIYKFLHLFPRFWQYAMKCTTCAGQGRVENKGADKDTKPFKVCPTCQGKRLKVSSDVSDVIALPIPKDGQPVLGGNMAGFIDTPDVAWDQMNNDILNQEMAMEYSLWGSYLTDRDNNKERTATESYINVQPINDELCVISRQFETKESQILSFMASIITQNEESIKVYYGKRFIIENPDTLWEKYLNAKEKQAPITTLDHHYDQYLMSEFQNNMEMYTYRKKLFSIEPMAHYSIEAIENVATNEQLQKKIIFSKWIQTDIDWTKDQSVLEGKFETYFTTNYKPEETLKNEQNEENE